MKTGTVRWVPFDQVPEVKKFSAKTFLVAFENLSTGKVYTSTADYLNGYRLQYEDDCGNKPNECPCEDGGGCPTTGWFESVPSDEYDRFYTKLDDGKYVKYLAWSEYPKYRANKKKAPTPIAEGTSVVVPVVPTEAMLHAYQSAIKNHIRSLSTEERALLMKGDFTRIKPYEKAKIRYRAMIAAAQAKEGE